MCGICVLVRHLYIATFGSTLYCSCHGRLEKRRNSPYKISSLLLFSIISLGRSIDDTSYESHRKQFPKQRAGCFVIRCTQRAEEISRGPHAIDTVVPRMSRLPVHIWRTAGSLGFWSLWNTNRFPSGATVAPPGLCKRPPSSPVISKGFVLLWYGPRTPLVLVA